MIGYLPPKKDQFIYMLSREERIALVRTLAYLAHRDHTLVQEEIDPISTIAYDLSLDPQIILANNGNPDLAHVLKPIKSEQSKRIVIQELVNFAYIDNEYVQEERDAVRNIAEILDVEATVVANIEEWVERGRAWMQEGKQLILGSE
jgi:uncharacterized tellurite resistance protein B-like protein